VRLLVIHNPAAGRPADRFLDRVLARVRDSSHAVEVAVTDGPGHARRLAEDAVSRAERLVIAGGDGTIAEAADGLVRSGARIPVAIVPLGTANVLACEIGLGRAPDAIARTITGGQVRDVSVGMINGRCFLLMAGAGFDAHVVGAVKPALKRRLGRMAYLWTSARMLHGFPYPDYAVAVDGREMRAASVVVTNARNYAGPYLIAPRADLASPTLEVCLFERKGAISVVRYGAALITGCLPRVAGFRVVSGRHVTISGPPGEPLQADGDAIGVMPADISVRPGALALVMPAA